jgi:membrane-associated protein
MEFLAQVLDFFIHLDVHLAEITTRYGVWTYAILFLIVFCETGLVITPFLPGDSLLFAAGAISALGSLDPVLLSVLLIIAAIIGDTVNYWIGSWIGPRAFAGEHRFLKREYLERTHAFYVKHGGKTIILARFVPIIRTFAPFVAGVGAMHYPRFLAFNVVGALLWVGIFVPIGYFFGNLPQVKEHFSLVILGIIILSVLPMVIEIVRGMREKRRLEAGAE